MITGLMQSVDVLPNGLLQCMGLFVLPVSACLWPWYIAIVLSDVPLVYLVFTVVLIMSLLACSLLLGFHLTF